MTYAELYALQRAESLIQRFTVAVQQYALTILQESTGVTNHAARVAWAKRTLSTFDSSRDYGYKTLRLTVTWKQGTIDWLIITDSDIQTFAETVIDKMITEGI